MGGFAHTTVTVIDITHFPILFQFVYYPNDKVSTGPADDTSSILWFCFNEPVYFLLDQDQYNFSLNLKEICGRWIGISTYTNFHLLPTPPLVNVYFPSPSTLPPIPLPTCSESAKVVLSPNHGERDNNKKYQLVIKDENKNKQQDNGISYIGIDAYTLYWIIPIMVSYLTIIQSVVRMHLSMLDYIDVTTKQQHKKDLYFMITGTHCSNDGHGILPTHATYFSKSNGYKVVNDHRDVASDNEKEIDDKDDEIANDKITHINDSYNLIVFDDETNHEVKIVFYDTSSSENVTATDIDVDYQLGVIDAGISSIHAPQKQPDEAQISAEEASKEIDINAFINDMNRFLLYTELHITSVMLYKTPSDEI